MFQPDFATAAPLVTTEVQDFLRETRLDAARAFRVLRDHGQIDFAAELDFIVRAPGDSGLARFGHPGPWSVSLEPKVTLIGPQGHLLAGARVAQAPIEEYLDLFERKKDLNAIVRLHGTHLDAWSRGGLDLPFVHMPLVRSELRQGVRLYEHGSAVAALGPAIEDNFAGVAHIQGGAVLAGESVLSLAELVLRIEKAAQVELLSELWRRSERLARRRQEERRPSWA
jgi:hypothetical protein